MKSSGCHNDRIRSFGERCNNSKSRRTPNPHNARLSLNLKTNQQGPTEGHRVRQPRTEPKNHRKRRCTKLVFFKALRKHDATITLPTCKTAIELRAHHMLVNVVLSCQNDSSRDLRQPLIASPLQIRKELLTTWL